MRKISESKLSLGWKLGPTGDPISWMRGKPKRGRHSEEGLVQIQARDIGAHIAVVAQSGSGKSFFLGRLIEEILLHTKARCVVIDPNSDFRRVNDLADEVLWKEATYNHDSRQGFLPTEKTRADSHYLWKDVKSVVLTQYEIDYVNYYPLQVWWPAISVDLFTSDFDPVMQSEFHHCHAFIKALSSLLCIRDGEIARLIEEAESLFIQGYGNFSSYYDAAHLAGRGRPAYNCGHSFEEDPDKFKLKIKELINQAENALKRVSKEAGRYYFSVAQEIAANNIIRGNCPSSIDESIQLEVIDLPSLSDSRSRLLAVNALLTTEWIRAGEKWRVALKARRDEDTRNPTFIVVDEAHNLIPAQPRNRAERALQEQFRTIAAEGRKFGLFLILVSQRPDKLDPLVLSECENKALMRLSSPSVLKIAARNLGLEDISPRLLNRCLEFGVGRAMLAGKWVGESPLFLYTAARRTVEGGRDLRADHWARK
jgi:hypothetical protein